MTDLHPITTDFRSFIGRLNVDAPWTTGIIIQKEMDRQDEKWGSQRDIASERWLSILVEEVGELAQALNDDDLDHAFVELVQCAAVCRQWVMAYVLNTRDALAKNNQAVDAVGELLRALDPDGAEANAINTVLDLLRGGLDQG